MSLPYFYTEDLSRHTITLDAEASKHIVQVLRMKSGQNLLLTDGRGGTAEARIEDPHKRHCSVQILSRENHAKPSQQLSIAISLVKNSSRLEWFVEKATELGVAEIIPMICERTEREKFRLDRYLTICKSAMLQSRQTWLPLLHEPREFNGVVSESNHHQKFIAHCAEDDKQSLHTAYDFLLETHIILIGPEGDFSQQEIEIARQHAFMPVSLGTNRLRTETAGIFAAVIGCGIA